jgi:hypothetical protein
MANIQNRISCSTLFKKFETFLLVSEYLPSLLPFLVDNMTIFLTPKYAISIRSLYAYARHILTLPTSTDQTKKENEVGGRACAAALS